MNLKNTHTVLESITNHHGLVSALTRVVRDLEYAYLPEDTDVCLENKIWVRGLIYGHVLTAQFYLGEFECNTWARETCNFIFDNCKPGLTEWETFEHEWIFRLIKKLSE